MHISSRLTATLSTMILIICSGTGCWSTSSPAESDQPSSTELVLNNVAGTENCRWYVGANPDVAQFVRDYAHAAEEEFEFDLANGLVGANADKDEAIKAAVAEVTEPYGDTGRSLSFVVENAPPGSIEAFSRETCYRSPGSLDTAETPTGSRDEIPDLGAFGAFPVLRLFVGLVACVNQYADPGIGQDKWTLTTLCPD